MVESIKELRKICQRVPGGEFENDITERIPRFFSIYVTKVLINTPLSANHISIINMGFSIVGSLLIAFGDIYWLKLMGAFVMFNTSILDCVDGEIARYRNQTSFAGLYLDRISAALAGWVLFLSLGLGLYLKSHELPLLLVGLSASSAWLFMRIVSLLFRANAMEVIITKRYQETLQNIDKLQYEKPPTMFGTAVSIKKLSLSYKVIDFLTVRYIIIIFVLIGSVLLEIFVRTFSIINIWGFKYPLSGLSIFLGLYGLLLPTVTVGYVIYNLKHRTTEYLYKMLMHSRATQTFRVDSAQKEEK